MSNEMINYRNTIHQGSCIDIMKAVPPGSIDFALTDPPYIANYKGRDGRSVFNDDNSRWLEPAFAVLHRVLKPHSFAISFYGWPKIDLFMTAWKKAGFRVAGHIIFHKKYGSKSAFLQYRHEGAYLLLKGNPAFPAKPLPDVMDWVYSGNQYHPTQKSIHILKPLIESFTRPGDLVLDPFMGSGSTCVAAQRTGRAYTGIDLDAGHCQAAILRLSSTSVRSGA